MQRKSCREFAKKMGWTIVGEEQGKFDILPVFMFDRLGRRSDETPEKHPCVERQ